MKVLFLFNSRSRFHPGLAILSAYLKEAGHRTDLVQINNTDYEEVLLSKIAAFEPDIIAANSTTLQYSYVKSILEFVRKRHPNIKRILGGVHAMITPDLIDDSDVFDAVCKGEGEEPLLQYVDAIASNNEKTDIPNMDLRVSGNVYKNPVTYYVEDLNKLPMPDYSLFPSFKNGAKLHFPMPFLFNRGCPFDCTYCCNHKIKEIFPKGVPYVRFMNAQRIIDEILYLSNKYQFEHYAILDDIFTLNKKNILEFCDKYPDDLMHKIFEVNVRVGTADKETFKALKEIGCTLVRLGIESGSESLRVDMLNRKMTNKEIIETANDLNEVEIPIHTYNMIGIPNESRVDIWKTISLNRMIKPTRIQITLCFPYKHTVLGKKSYDSGLVKLISSDNYFKETIIFVESIIKFNPLKLIMSELYFYRAFFKFFVFVGIDNAKAFNEFREAVKYYKGLFLNPIKDFVKNLISCKGRS